MAAGDTDRGFKLVIPDLTVRCVNGADVTLRCHLSPGTSAVALEIRWFRRTDCIYLYKNGHVIEGRGYEGRVSVDPQQLQRGGVSLRLRGSRREDEGVYTCQVISGDNMEEGRVELKIRSGPIGAAVGALWGAAHGAAVGVVAGGPIAAALSVVAGVVAGAAVGVVAAAALSGPVAAALSAAVVRREITAEERKKMEESVQSLDPDPPPTGRKRRNSIREPPDMGGENPDPAPSESPVLAERGKRERGGREREKRGT